MEGESAGLKTEFPRVMHGDARQGAQHEGERHGLGLGLSGLAQAHGQAGEENRREQRQPIEAGPPLPAFQPQQARAQDAEAQGGQHGHAGGVTHEIQVEEPANVPGDGSQAQAKKNRRDQDPRAAGRLGRPPGRDALDGEEQEADGGHPGHAPRMADLNGQIVLHQELIDPQIRPASVLEQGQNPGHGRGRGQEGARARMFPCRQRERRPAHHESQGRVVLHGHQMGQDLGQNRNTGVPADQGRQAQNDDEKGGPKRHQTQGQGASKGHGGKRESIHRTARARSKVENHCRTPIKMPSPKGIANSSESGHADLRSTDWTERAGGSAENIQNSRTSQQK